MQYNEELGMRFWNANYHVHNKLFIVICDCCFWASVSGCINTRNNLYRSVYLCFIDRAQVQLFFSLSVNNVFMELVTAKPEYFFRLAFIASLSE